MKKRLRNIFHGVGSILQLYNHNSRPSLSPDVALGELKNFKGNMLNDTLNIHKDIGLAWRKVVEFENRR